MRYLYADNFRGFSNTFIPIRDVNFLVGENSTGKTSILGLLKLISSPRFWFEQSFDTEEVKFGHFSDIVSVNALDRSKFSIGIIEDSKIINKNEKEPVKGFLMTFFEKEGVPCLYKCSCSMEDEEYHIILGEKQIQFKVITREKCLDINVFQKKVFAEWIKLNKNVLKGFNKIKLPEPGSKLPFFVILSIIERAHKGDSNKSRSDAFTIPNFGPQNEFAWIAPIRTKPRRTYDEYRLDFSPEGTHTPYLIRKILDKKKDSLSFLKFVKDFGKASGLFETISVRQYGRTKTAPFELDIILNEKALNMSNVGYGVSQSLPVIVELFTREEGSWFGLQQPEVHLHPKAQAALGDIVYELVYRERKKFVIETHSDFIIDRFRLNYRKSDNKHPDSQILFFNRLKSGNAIYPIRISENGELPSDQPDAYRKFFLKEQFELLTF